MRVLVLCVATFAGGLLAGIVLWPSRSPPARRAAEGAREPRAPLPGAVPSGHTPGEAAGGAGDPVAALPARAADTPLRTLAAEAAAELARVLERPAAVAFLEGDGTVTGSVRDVQGQPIAGVIVTASPEAQPFDLAMSQRRARERAHEDVDLDQVARDAIQGELWRRQVRHTTETGADGRYEMKELVKGWHRITAFHEEYELRPDPQNNRVQPDAVVDFLAHPASVVPVEVRLPDGELADYAWISWQGPHGNGWDTWKPEPGGVRLPKGTHRVRAQTWVPDALQSPEVEYDAGSGAPLVLRLEGRRTLAARLVPAEGLAVPEGVEFRLRRLEGGAPVDPESLKGDQARSTSSSQGRATWYDLEPGRYLVAAFLGGRHLLAHAVAEWREGSVEVGLPFDGPPPGAHLLAKLLAPEGGPVRGNPRFAVVAGQYHNADALRKVDGTWLVLLPEVGEAADATLRVTVWGYGTEQENFDPRRPGSVTIRFKEPAKVRVRVDRFTGSGVEGKLFAALAGEEGVVATRQVEADGSCDLGSVQPRSYALILFVRDRDSRWPVLRREVALRAGEHEDGVAVPPLHTLRVRPAPNLRAREVTLLSSDPSIGSLRRVERVSDDVATFAMLAAGQYEVRCGNKRVDVRVPGPELSVE